MGCKFSFKRVFLVALLCLAGLFGASSHFLNQEVHENQIEEKVEAATYPENPNYNYRHIWFYIACDWADTHEFDGHLENKQSYTLWINGSKNSTENYYGMDYSSSNRHTYSEVHGPRLVKVFYDKDITTKIQFYNGYYNVFGNVKERLTEEIAINDSIEGKVYVLTDYHWGGYGTGSDYQVGSWITYEELTTSYLQKAFFAITSGWNPLSGSSLKDFWVWTKMELRDARGNLSTKEYAKYQLTRRPDTIVIDGTTYLEVLVPKRFAKNSDVYTNLLQMKFLTYKDGDDEDSTEEIYGSVLYLRTTPRMVVTTFDNANPQSVEITNFDFGITYLEKDGSSFAGTHAQGYPQRYTYLVGTTLDTPTRSNLNFGGYYLNSDFSGSPITSFTTNDGGNKTLYVKWTATITWENYDHYTIKTDTIELGETPEYVGNTPLKPQEGSTSYDFSGWSPTVVAVH